MKTILLYRFDRRLQYTLFQNTSGILSYTISTNFFFVQPLFRLLDIFNKSVQYTTVRFLNKDQSIPSIAYVRFTFSPILSLSQTIITDILSIEPLLTASLARNFVIFFLLNAIKASNSSVSPIGNPSGKGADNRF